MARSQCFSVIAVLFAGAIGIPVASAQLRSDKTPTTVTYDLRDILAKPEIIDTWPFGGGVASPWNAFKQQAQLRNLTLPEKSARLVQAIVALVDGVVGERKPFDQANIQVLNGTRLVVRANAEKHAEVASLLAAFRRLGDLAVIVNTKLFEVDDAFHTKLKNAKPVDWEAEERLYLEGKLPKNELFEALAKQKPVQIGDEVKGDNGFTATLLARQHAVSLSPNREQVVQGQKNRQTVLEGVVFSAGIRVTPDRRAVRVQLTENASEISQVKKVKVMISNDGKEAEAEIPFVNETAHKREIEIPDGGAMLIPVQYRPKSIQEKNRWWVLHISPRIWIEEEEQQVRLAALEALTPLVVADVLRNPRIKANRNLYDMPGDKRFALIDSVAWKWPGEFKADVAGFERALAKRAGARLLGIRVDQFQQAKTEGEQSKLTISLINAGGSDDGSVLGTCVLRYEARSTEKGWSVALSEN